MRFLLLGPPDDDGIDPEGDGEEGGGHTEIGSCHLFGDPKEVPPSAAQPTDLFRKEEQVESEFGSEHLFDQIDGKLVVLIKVKPGFLVETTFGHRLEGLQNKPEGFVVQSGALAVHNGPPLAGADYSTGRGSNHAAPWQRRNGGRD